MNRDTIPTPSTRSVGISTWDLTQGNKFNAKPEDNLTENTSSNSLISITPDASPPTTDDTSAASTLTPTMPPTFHPYPNLPKELQLQILSHAQASISPRLITLTSYSIPGHRFCPSTAQFCKPQKPHCPFGTFARIERMYALATPLPLLCVSREIREELIDKNYRHSMSGDIFPDDEFDINQNTQTSWLRGNKVFAAEPPPNRVTRMDLTKDILYFSDGGNFRKVSDPLAALSQEIASGMERMACTVRIFEILFFWEKDSDLRIFKSLKEVIIFYGGEKGTNGWSGRDWGVFHGREDFEEQMGKVFGGVERRFSGWRRPAVRFEETKEDFIRSLN